MLPLLVIHTYARLTYSIFPGPNDDEYLLYATPREQLGAKNRFFHI